MQPTYVYPSEVDPEAQWRSKFSMLIPIVIGFLQFILTLAIIGLEIGSVFISPIKGTLYAGFWCSAIFILSWISMSILGKFFFSSNDIYSSLKCFKFVVIVRDAML